MRIAVAGGTGLVGRHVVEALARAGGHDVVATWHKRPPFPAPGVRWIQGDLRDAVAARAVLSGAEAAVLCAGRLSTSAELRRDPLRSVLATQQTVTTLLEAAARAGLSRLVLLSSCTGYPALDRPAVEADMEIGDPPAPWFGVGWMHRYLEKQVAWYVRELGLIGSAVILRPTLVYGPHDDFTSEGGHFVPSLVRRVVARERPIEIWGDGTATRNLLHAADLAEAVVQAVTLPGDTLRAFNVVSPHQASVGEVVAALVDLDGFSDAELAYDPGRGGGPAALDVSGEAFARACAWRVRRSLRDGLADTVSWYRRRLADSMPERAAEPLP